ncbi:MAG: DUF4091 domain-containing protein [Promethearchaeota archaeon]
MVVVGLALWVRGRVDRRTFSTVLGLAGFGWTLLVFGLYLGGGLVQPPGVALQLAFAGRTWLLHGWIAVELVVTGDLALRSFERAHSRNSGKLDSSGAAVGFVAAFVPFSWAFPWVGVPLFAVSFTVLNGLASYLAAFPGEEGAGKPGLGGHPPSREWVPDKRQENAYSFLFLVTAVSGVLFALFFDKRVLSFPSDFTWIAASGAASVPLWNRAWRVRDARTHLKFHAGCLAGLIVLISVPGLIFWVKDSVAFLVVGGVLLGGLVTGYSFYFDARLQRGGNASFSFSNFPLAFLAAYLAVQGGLLLSTDTFPGYVPWIMQYVNLVFWILRGVWGASLVAALWWWRKWSGAPPSAQGRMGGQVGQVGQVGEVGQAGQASPATAFPRPPRVGRSPPGRTRGAFVAVLVVGALLACVPTHVLAYSTHVVARSRGSHALWLDYPLERVDPHWKPPDLESAPVVPRVDIKLARNEYETFQLVLSATGSREVTVTSVSVSDLVLGGDPSRAIPAGNVSVRVGRYVLGSFLDALVPLGQAGNLAWQGRNLELAFTVYCPTTATPGNYSGTIDLQVGGREHQVSLGVEVWNFTIPVERHLRTTFELRNHGNRALLESLRSHRVSPYGEVPVPFLNFSEGTLEANFNFSKEWREGMEEAFDHGMNLFRLGNGGMKGAVVSSDYDVGNVTALENYYRGLVAELSNHTRGGKTWLEYGYVYIWDEPHPSDYYHIEKLADIIHEVSPAIRILLTTQSGSLPAAVEDKIDIWVPMLLYELDWSQLNRRWAAGHENWFYTCVGADFPLPNLWINTPLACDRALFWYAFTRGFDGYLYWAVDFGANYQRGVGFNAFGDGVLLYPWADGKYSETAEPVESYRWEMVRDGLEDFEFFHLLSGLAGSAAATAAVRGAASDLLARVNGSVRDKCHYELDQGRLDELRASIGSFLDEHAYLLA